MSETQLLAAVAVVAAVGLLASPRLEAAVGTCRPLGTTETVEKAAYRRTVVGDVDGDGKADTVFVATRRSSVPARCRYVLVARGNGWIARSVVRQVSQGRDIRWQLDVPEILALARIDRRAGAEIVVRVTMARAPGGAVYTVRGRQIRRYAIPGTAQAIPPDTFTVGGSGRLRFGLDCADSGGSGRLYASSAWMEDDGRFSITRTYYKTVGLKFEKTGRVTRGSVFGDNHPVLRTFFPSCRLRR